MSYNEVPPTILSLSINGGTDGPKPFGLPPAERQHPTGQPPESIPSHGRKGLVPLESRRPRPNTLGPLWGDRAEGGFSRSETRGLPDIRTFNFYRREKPTRKHTPGQNPTANKDDCGQVKFQIVCPDNPDHHRQLITENCKGATCPQCWPAWAMRASRDSADRIEAYGGIVGRTPRHFVLSPPQGAYGEDDRERFLTDSRDLLAKYGVEAAAVVPHALRLVETDDDAADVDYADDGSLKPSRSNRYRKALEAEDWQDRVYVSPHLHMMVYGPMPDYALFYEKTGWILKNLECGDWQTRGRGRTELEGTINYLLSHAWIEGNKKAIRYWFDMSTKRMGKVEDEPVMEQVLCPKCGAVCVKLPPDIYDYAGKVIEIYQDLHNAPELWVKRRQFRYFLRCGK